MARLDRLLTASAFAAGSWLVYGPRAGAAAVTVAALVLGLTRPSKPRRRPQRRRSDVGRVYLLHAPVSGLYKIGWTGRQVAQRLEELRAGSREPIQLVTWGHGGRDVERALHLRYQLWRVPNTLPAPTEWFALGDYQAREVRAFLTGTHRAKTAA